MEVEEIQANSSSKGKIALLVCTGLIVILGFSTLFFFMDLQAQENLLTHRLTSLEAEYEIYKNRHSYSNIVYEDYVSSHQYSNAEYLNYVDNHPYTEFEYEQACYSFYYMKPETQKFGVYNLDDELQQLFWTEPYQREVFDCSEMSACLEWYLENKGWHTKIVSGDSPFGSGRHAWLLVEASDGKYMPVESTSIRVVWWDDQNWDGYWEYDRRFETIQDALEYSEYGYDWWELGFCPLEN